MFESGLQGVVRSEDGGGLHLDFGSGGAGGDPAGFSCCVAKGIEVWIDVDIDGVWWGPRES